MGKKYQGAELDTGMESERVREGLFRASLVRELLLKKLYAERTCAFKILNQNLSIRAELFFTN